MNNSQPLTERTLQTTHTKNHALVLISLKPWVKAAIIKAYCHGLIPAKLTRWIIQKGRLRHD